MRKLTEQLSDSLKYSKWVWLLVLLNPLLLQPQKVIQMGLALSSFQSSTSATPHPHPTFTYVHIFFLLSKDISPLNRLSSHTFSFSYGWLGPIRCEQKWFVSPWARGLNVCQCETLWRSLFHWDSKWWLLHQPASPLPMMTTRFPCQPGTGM